MPNFYPKVCNICRGEVNYVADKNKDVIEDYNGSGYMYVCSKCGAYIGTHSRNPKKARGILADEEMNKLKRDCHFLVDSMWKTHRERKFLYMMLAEELGIKQKECHFSYFNKKTLKKCKKILEKWSKERKWIKWKLL